LAGKDDPSQRRGLLAAELRRIHADCAVITHPKHVFYLTGIPTNLNMWFSVMKGPRLTSILIVDQNGKAGLLAGKSEGVREREGTDPQPQLELGLTEYTDYSLSDGMVAYGDKLATETKKWLGKMDSKFDSVAVEDWHIPEAFKEALSTVRPGFRSIGMSKFLLSMRNSKGKDEVESLERAARIVDHSYKVARQEAKVGNTELDVYGEVNADSFRKFGPFAWVVGDYASGERSLQMGGPPTRRKMRRGDTIILDLQAPFGNYWSDLCRTFVVGGAPNRAQEKALSLLKEAKSAAEEVLLPGTKGKEVYEAVCDVLERGGYPRLPHHAGHGIGLDDQEPPWFIPVEERRLEVGSVCVVEPGIYRKDSGGIRIEDQYVIAEGGPRKLSRFPLDLS
jgi:Xaa-Pro aminopeptidase